MRWHLFFLLFFLFFEITYMKCLRCNNEDPKFFGYDQGIYYCRKCISFSRINANEKIEPCLLKTRKIKANYHLQYELTPYQKKISNQVLDYLKNKQDVFLYACTGAGKTEITYQSIQWYLNKGLKIAFAISRRQVVLEIKNRLEKAFPTLSIVAVTQGYTGVTDGDIIVCTMHQLYRYPYGFDLLIMDEVDAFPYVGNDVLQAVASLSCKGQMLYLSATPDNYSKAQIESGNMKMVNLFKRPHGYPLPVPKIIVLPTFLQVFFSILSIIKFIDHHQQVIVFAPRIEDTILYHFIYSLFFKNKYIHSKTEDKDEIMKQFRNKEFDCLISTTLLERGITIPNVQVIVIEGNHSVFTCASLIQIFGRAGRDFNNPEGKCICFCSKVTKSIKECVKELKMMNDSV